MFKNKESLSYLWSFIYRQKQELFLAIFYSILLVVSSIIQIRLLKNLIDYLVDDMLSYFIISLIIYLILIFLNYLIYKKQKKCAVKLSSFMSENIKEDLSDKILFSSYKDILKLQAGDILKTLSNDTNNVCSFVENSMVDLFVQFSTAIFAYTYMMFLCPKLAFATFLFTPIGMKITFYINKKMNNIFPVIMKKEAEGLSNIEQIIYQIPVVKSFMVEKYMKAKVETHYDECFSYDMKLAKWNALMQTACSMTSMIPRTIFFFYAGHLYFNGYMSIGLIISLLELISFVIGPSVYMPFILNNFNRCSASIERIKVISDLYVYDEVEEKSCQSPRIKFDEVSFAYVNGNNVLDKLSFDFNKPGIYVISGKSGVGKSTVLELAAGLYNNYCGNIERNGSIAFVTQDKYMFSENIHDNVRVVRKDASEDEFCRAIKFSGSQNILDIDDVNKLSGGQKQRVSFARAILKDADVLILDEPTAYLDKDNEEIVLSTLSRFKSKKIIIITSHKENILNLADRRVELCGK